MIPASQVRPVRFSAAQVGDVLFSAHEDFNRLLVVQREQQLYAVFLEGEHAGMAITLDAQQTRTGFAVRGARLSIDHGSIVRNQSPAGSIALTSGGFSIRAQVPNDGPFVDADLFVIDGVPAPASDLACTRWRLAVPLADGSEEVIFAQE